MSPTDHPLVAPVPGPDDPEYQHLRRSFTIGIILSLLVLVLIGYLIHKANQGHNRPEGAAEDYLTAIGDLTREGVKSDAVERAREFGPVRIGLPLLPKEDTDGHAAFPDLEVGKANERGADTRVPYRLHQYASSGDNPERTGVVILRARPDDSWRVAAIGPRTPKEKVPSEGGDPPSSAPPEVWIFGALFGVFLTIVVSLLIRWATPKGVQPAAA